MPLVIMGIPVQLWIWIAVNPDNATKMVNTLQTFGFNVPELSSDLFLQENKIIRMGVPPVRLEILTTISGVDFATCYAQRTVDIIDGVEINLISLQHLKQNKKASGRYNRAIALKKG